MSGSEFEVYSRRINRTGFLFLAQIPDLGNCLSRWCESLNLLGCLLAQWLVEQTIDRKVSGSIPACNMEGAHLSSQMHHFHRNEILLSHPTLTFDHKQYYLFCKFELSKNLFWWKKEVKITVRRWLLRILFRDNRILVVFRLEPGSIFNFRALDQIWWRQILVDIDNCVGLTVSSLSSHFLYFS